MPSIEARGLTKRYGGFLALDDASFKFEGSGAIGYLGPNGAGKTTTLKLLTGLARPTAGRGLLNGVDIGRDPKRALWDVGTVIESPEPYPWQTGQRTLEMVAAFRGVPMREARAKIKELASELDLPPLDKKTGALSKGQRQRVVIASSLLSDPSVIILDEPTSGLDPAERIAVRNILVQLKREHLILMSSHLLSEVTEVCDRAIFINHGKILLNETVQNIAKRAVDTQVDVEFVVPIHPDQLGSIAELVRSVVALSPTKLRIDYSGHSDARPEILKRCVAVGPVLSYASATLVLEDAYLQLIGGGVTGANHLAED
ncbi:MAG: ABC transporter ATP-binding protein [Candidatus Thermoplasmatota archaeon]|nr:ABC transporter ATP-binding protein [Candidatus Thermoplasmatota archaeon]